MYTSQNKTNTQPNKDYLGILAEAERDKYDLI
jgi:hypothetical protein